MPTPLTPNPGPTRGMCTAIVPGVKGECQRPVPVDSPIRLCLLHALLAHQYVVELGGAVAVATTIRKEAS